MYVLHHIEARSYKHCWSGKTLIIKYYSECVSVAFIVHHAMRMRRAVIVACPAVQYFFYIISKKGRILGEKIYWK
jgi:hypothetical protein